MKAKALRWTNLSLLARRSVVEAAPKGRGFCPSLLTLILLCLFSFPLQAAPLRSETFTLPNGLQVVVIPNHKVPAVSHMVWYKVGAMDETPGKSGLAHFLEHLMFKGTQKLIPGEFSDIVARNGGIENAFTTRDFTAYFQNIAVDKLPLVMELEADRMQNLSLKEAEVNKERDVIVEERYTRVDNNPQALLAEQMQAALYLNHPYRRPLIGWLHEIRTLTYKDAEDFYRHFYAPNNAILVVAGDITAAELKPLAMKYYGAIPRKEIIRALPVVEPQQRVARRMTLYDKKVKKPVWLRYYLAPTQTAGESKHAYALVVLSHILGEGRTSRFDQSLVVEKQIATSVASSYNDLGRGEGGFALYAVPKEGVPLTQVEQAMEDVIATLLKNGVTQKELDQAKQYLVAQTLYAQEGFRSQAYAYGQALTSGMDTDYVENWDNNIAKVTKEDVEAAARYVLQPERSVTGWLMSGEEK